MDVEELAVAWLAAHPRLRPMTAERVGARNEPPYPRLRVTQVPGGRTDLRWLTTVRLQLEVLADLDGQPAKATLLRILHAALTALAELPRRAVAGRVVVTDVQAVGAGAWLPLVTGQGRYTALVSVTAHPAPAR